jgi:predicted phosphoribosyltransferase
MGLFTDRRHAGRVLAAALKTYAGRDDLVVLALPRGGVPVAYEVARRLHAPLNVWLVRKLGVPGHEELAMGAIASGGVRVLQTDVAQAAGVSAEQLQRVTARERAELARREEAYRDGKPPLDLRGRTAILIDDGLATGASMRAANLALRQHAPARIVVAVPTASPDVCAELQRLVDEMLCAATPQPFYAVGAWYDDFSQTTDDEVRELLRRAEAVSVVAGGPAQQDAIAPD